MNWAPNPCRAFQLIASGELKDEEKTEDGWILQIVSYQVENRQALSDYLAGPAATLRADGPKRFGPQMRA
ncbi:hypothetical protein J2T60_002468 [Natronospira proteinivora]|uniref:Uncharacterized protein n=1 Tax=Natronospira proteinivora TaxID=1807133 RepID=A0ABT1GDZ2_9GAMM|nr:hypothetical protein [Natronospira proteinivora]